MAPFSGRAEGASPSNAQRNQYDNTDPNYERRKRYGIIFQPVRALYTTETLPTGPPRGGSCCFRGGGASFTDRRVRMIGDAALVTGGAAIEAEINGQPRSLRLKFLNV